MLRAAIFLALTVSLMLCSTPARAQDAAARVWVASPWEHVLLDTPPGAADSIHLTAAANEYEPFRVVVTAGATPLTGVSVVVSDLAGPAGIIPASNVCLYREHYFHLDVPSYRSPSPPGWYPDALIPFVDPETGAGLTGARFDGTPYDVSANSNQGVWADILVPTEAAPGEYQGVVTVIAGSDPIADLPITLTVHDFALPDTIAMRSWFGLWGLAGFLGMDAGDPEFAHIRDLYMGTLFAHRCVSNDLGEIWPWWDPDTGLQDVGNSERLQLMVESSHANALSAPFWHSDNDDCFNQCLDRLHALESYLSDNDALDLALVYMKDEPNSAADYEIVREEARRIHEAAPGLKRLCAEQTLTQDPSWGTLEGYVDIWCPLWGLYDEPTARQRQALGEEMWSYTALCQMDASNPFWEIDFAPISYRAPFWTSWHYYIKGFLYWSTIYWDLTDDVWLAPVYRAWDLNFWGEGILLYPGADVGTEAPAPSIRLKLIREAMEDFEYMTLAARRGGREPTDAIVDGVTTAFTDWSRDPEVYFSARQELAALILRHIFPDVDSDHWAFEQIRACVEAGVVSGYRDGLYHPNNTVTRDQMAVFIARALAGGDANVPPAGGPPSFSDVPADHWAYRHIEYAAANDVVKGYPDGLYRPERRVDRAQLAVYVARARGWVGLEDDMTVAPELFPDVPAGYWAGTAIQACLEHGVVQGYDDGLYRPDTSVSRDQMAVYIAQAFGLGS